MTDEDKRLYDKAVEALDQMGAGLPSEIEKYVPAWIDGYQEGLKAKINATTISDCPIKDKWHKVADGDLPKENKLYLVAIKDNGLAIAYFNSRHWETKYNLGDFGHCVETVIAWCEIPQYTEE